MCFTGRDLPHYVGRGHLRSNGISIQAHSYSTHIRTPLQFYVLAFHLIGMIFERSLICKQRESKDYELINLKIKVKDRIPSATVRTWNSTQGCSCFWRRNCCRTWWARAVRCSTWIVSAYFPSRAEPEFHYSGATKLQQAQVPTSCENKKGKRS